MACEFGAVAAVTTCGQAYGLSSSVSRHIPCFMSLPCVHIVLICHITAMCSPVLTR